MPTIIDELVIKLGLDSSGFQRQVSTTQAAVTQTGAVARRETRTLEETIGKTQAATQKRMRQVEEVGRGAVQGFTRLRHEVVGLLGAIAGAYGIQQFIRNVTTANAALGYAAKSIGLSVPELAAWDEAGKRVGGTAGDVTAALRGISAETQHFLQFGESSAIPVLRRLESMPGAMLAFRDATGEATKPVEFLLALSDRLSKMSLPEALSVGAQIPGMNETTIRLAHEGRGAINRHLAEARRLGVPGEQDAEAAVKLQKAWDDLQQTAINLGNIILRNLTPRITEALQAMTEWVIESKKWLPQEVEEKLNAFIEILKKVGSAIKEVVDYLGGWERTTITIFGLWAAAKVAVIVGPIISLAAAMLSLATATTAVDVAAGGSGIRWLMGLLSGAAGAALLAILGEEMLYRGTRIGPAGDPDEERRVLGGSFGDRFSNLRVNPTQPTADLSMTPAKRTLLDALSIGESRGDYNIKNPDSTAHGRYQFLDRTDAEVSARTGLPGQDPVSQDKKGWYLAATTYARNTGRDLEADVKAGGREAEIAAALKGVWPSLPGGTQQNTTPEIWLRRMREAGTANPSVRIPPVGPTFGPQLPPQSAIDPGMRFALRSPASAVDNSRSNTSSSETHIGAVNIHTAATDAEGISKGIGGALKKYAFVPQANYGLT